MGAIKKVLIIVPEINTNQSTNSTITSNSSSSNNSELVSPNLNQSSITFEETTITFSEEDRQPSNRTTGNWGRFGGIGAINLSLEYADNPETDNENQSSKVIKVTEPLEFNLGQDFILY